MLLMKNRKNCYVSQAGMKCEDLNYQVAGQDWQFSMEILWWKILEACCFLPLGRGTAALWEGQPWELWFPPLRSIPRVMCFSSRGVFQLALTLECSLLLLDSCADSICFRGGQRQGRLPRTECRFLIRLRIIGSCKRISWELEDLLQLKLMKNICNVCG